MEHPRQGFSPARNVRSLNPWHFDSRFPAAECVFEFDNKLSGERNSSVDTVVSPSLEFALVDTSKFLNFITKNIEFIIRSWSIYIYLC